MLKTNYKCVRSPNISVDVAKCGEICSQIHSCTFTFGSVTKKMTCLHWTIYSWQRFQLISLSSYAKNKLQLCSVTQHQCRCCQMCWNFSQIHPVHSLFICYTEWLVLTEQFFPVRFQLISLSSYAKNKLQMFSVIQHQCRRLQMCWKCSQIHPVYSLFVRYKKRLVLIEQSIHGKLSTH